jgi:hypothetical protein
MVAFWGERYRDYFVDLFLPSMLAPNNLPLLQTKDGHRFFIAAPHEDWEAMRELPIMVRLQRHVEPCWVKIDSATETEGTDAHARYAAMLEHMKVCFRTLLEAGYDPSSYGSFHAPDTIISDGMVASMLRSVRAGHHLLLVSALRQSEEGVLADIKAWGLLQPGPPPSSTAHELILSPRVAADLAVRHLHPEMAVFEEGARDQPSLPPFRYWRMPEGRGILLHTFFGLPVLMDFSVVPATHTSCLDHDAFENVYITENFRGRGDVRMVPDSDEFSVLSLTPEAVNHSAPVRATDDRRTVLRREYERMCDVRRSIEFYVLRKLDAVRRDLFRTPVRWHSGELDDVWRKEEGKIERLLDRAAGDYFRQDLTLDAAGSSRSTNWRSLLLDVPWLNLPAVLRGLVYRVLLKVRELASGAAFR